MRRKMGTSLLATIAAMAALAPQASAAPAGAALGISDNAYHAGTPAAFWADIEALRPQLFRTNLYWRGIARTQPAQPTNPADPAYDWRATDDLVRGLKARGVPTLVTVYGTPDWAALFGGSRCTSPANWPLYCQARAPAPIKLGQFLKAAATRYSGTYRPTAGAEPLPRVTLWEIWNETNNRNFLVDGRRKPSATVYARMLRESAKALRGVARPKGYKVTVIAGGVGGRLGIKHADFFRQLARSQTCRASAGRVCFDAISIHAYNQKPRLGLQDRPGAGFFSVGNFGQFTRLVKQLWPSRSFPIYVTEFGWQTSPPDPTPVAVTLSQQSRFLRDTVQTFRARHPRVKALVWWLMEDDQDIVGNWQSGLRFLNGPTKPAFATFSQLTGG